MRGDIQSAVLQSVVGGLTGIFANKFNKSVIKIRNPYLALIAKTVICIIVLHTITELFPEFAAEWQSTLPGLFFVGTFFGTQTNLMSHFTEIENGF